MSGAIHILFHPRATARRLASQAGHIAAIEEQLTDCRTELENLRDALEKSRAAAASLSQAIESEHLRADRLRAENLSLREKMTADAGIYAEQERRILEVERQFEQVGHMADTYERRIAALKERLADARRLLGDTRRERDDELTPLRPDIIRPVITSPTSPPAPTDPPEPDEWFTTPEELP